MARITTHTPPGGTAYHMVRDHAGHMRICEVDDQGDPQVFPYDNASTQVMRNAAALSPDDRSLVAEYVREVAQSVRDHRDGFTESHNANCRGDVYRALCD